MNNGPDLKHILKHTGYLREGDVVFVGDFTKNLGRLEKNLGFLFTFSGLEAPKGPLEEHYSGYLRVDWRGTVLYNSMENTGILGSFLRRHGIIGPDKDWNKKIYCFNYSGAFRMRQGKLEKISGNLARFQLDYDKNILRDLDWGEITEFLKVGDYSASGTIKVVQ